MALHQASELLGRLGGSCYSHVARYGGQCSLTLAVAVIWEEAVAWVGAGAVAGGGAVESAGRGADGTSGESGNSGGTHTGAVVLQLRDAVPGPGLQEPHAALELRGWHEGQGEGSVGSAGR